MVFQRYWRKREECVVEKFEAVVLAFFEWYSMKP
jgi:hypothetical protein